MAEIDWTAIREEALGNFTLAALPPTVELPALPHAVTTFLDRSKDPDAPLADLAKIVETDTGLTIELLKYVNSSYMGLRVRANSAQRALTVLGQRRSRTFVVTQGMAAAVRARRSKLINQSCFWNASLQKALFAKEVARLFKADEDLAFGGALLQDYLLPVVTNDLFESYLRLVDDRPQFPECIVDWENEQFGWDHALAGACLAHRWLLPDDLVCCVLFHHLGLRILLHPQLGRSAAAAVAISALLPDQLRQNFRGLETLLALQEKWPAFDLQAMAVRVDEAHKDLGLGVRNDFPLARRCQPVLDTEAACDDGTLNRKALEKLAAAK